MIEGFIFAIAAAICNGSYLVPFKSKSVTMLKVDPLVFQIYASMGIFVASWFLLAFLPFNPHFIDGSSTKFAFVPLALLSGCLVVLSMTFSFFATKKIGVALAQGIFGGLAIIVSYIWGLVLFNEKTTNPVLSVFGIVLIVLGVAAIGACKELSAILVLKLPSLAQHASASSTATAGATDRQDSKASVDIEVSGISLTAMENTVKNDDQEAKSEEFQNNVSLMTDKTHSDAPQRTTSLAIFLPPSIDRTDFIQGCIYAVLCGIVGGSSLVPLHYIPAEHTGFALFPALGVGALITAPVVLLCYCQVFKVPYPAMGFDIGMYSGMLAGVIWTANSVLTIGAIPILGYSVAFPLVHCSVFISGLWGIYFFHEFDGFALSSLVFFSAGATVIGGAIMISIGK
jgi:glucose uptake protein GlcU